MSISSLLIRLVVIAAVLTGLAVVGRATGSRWRAAPAPGPGDQRGRRGTNPLVVFGIVLGSLLVLTLGWVVMFFGTWWMACRGGGSC